VTSRLLPCGGDQQVLPRRRLGGPRLEEHARCGVVPKIASAAHVEALPQWIAEGGANRRPGLQ